MNPTSLFLTALIWANSQREPVQRGKGWDTAGGGTRSRRSAHAQTDRRERACRSGALAFRTVVKGPRCRARAVGEGWARLRRRRWWRGAGTARRRHAGRSGSRGRVGHDQVFRAVSGRAGLSRTLGRGVDRRPPEESHPARLSLALLGRAVFAGPRQRAPDLAARGLRTRVRAPAEGGCGGGERRGGACALRGRGRAVGGERGRAAAGGRGRRQGDDRGSRAARSGSLCRGESPPADTPTASCAGVGAGIAPCRRCSPAGRGLKAEAWG